MLSLHRAALKTVLPSRTATGAVLYGHNDATVEPVRLENIRSPSSVGEGGW
jgi:hypothetical protein